ncbi:tautomerase family protein [Paenibacillus sp. N3.4]|uniref:tautomerase family protein n=1 Tax=Paenibacillus sp. N3.4 TaxID=2603222 RepID=UPI0011C869C5|nr:tautomerase family protein [Paenibacillus sp. N3.4]TXK81447.1 tautomerase family protein [Paenibacillus sp. N3.4]
MPFVRVSYLENQYTDKDLPRISQCILKALIEHFNVPEDDYFQVFHAHKKSEFYYSKDYLNASRTDQLLYIQITLKSGRSRDQKCSFYKKLAELLSSQCKIKEDNVFVVLNETEFEDWTFGKGIAQMIL